MPRGRKPLPSHLKVVKGTDRADRRNEDEPIVELSIPTPPRELSDDAKVEWGRVAERLYRMGCLSDVDRATLAAYCSAYGQWIEAERLIRQMAERDPITRGMMIKTTNGNMIQNPLVGVANKAKADFVRYAAEFGMTPSARSRIKAEREKDGKPNPAARFFGS